MGTHPTLLITGASGLAGGILHRVGFAGWRVALAVHRRTAPSPLRRGDRVVKVDLATSGAAANLVAATEPQAVIHLAAIASLAECEADPARATRLNIGATEELARAAATAGAYFILLSTDQVFDGEPPADPRGELRGFREDDEARPLTIYGATKLAAERAVLAEGECLVVRCALLLAPSADGRSGALDMVRGAAAGPVRLFRDEWRTPLSGLDLARLLDEALRRRATGVLHAAGPDRVNRFELGERIAAAFPAPVGTPPPQLLATAQSEASQRRPRDVSLATERIDREGWPRPAPLAAALAELAALTTAPRRG